MDNGWTDGQTTECEDRANLHHTTEFAIIYTSYYADGINCDGDCDSNWLGANEQLGNITNWLLLGLNLLVRIKEMSILHGLSMSG